MAEHGPLTMSDLTSLQVIAQAAETNSRVSWVTDGPVLHGTARSIGDERGNFLSGKDDVRDGFLRITSKTGFEYFLPVTQLIHMVRDGYLALDSWEN
jgi:hypothetical protein